MSNKNLTDLKEFILIGFTQNVQICKIIFATFFLIYLMTILGNSFLICAVITQPKLHIPMYFFLCNLSFLDLCFSSCSVPKLLTDVLSSKRTISIIGCMAQMNIGLSLGAVECILLAVMAYDRYIAICFPLHYTVIINWKVCVNIAVIIWVGAVFLAIGPNIANPLVFCTHNKLNHFACEILALLELACGNLILYRVRIFIASILLSTQLVFIVASYFLIISSVLKIQSTEGRSKAFLTCASHLTVVFMFYGTILTAYIGQATQHFSQIKYIALTYGVFTPLLNPLVYSLRNNDVKEAFLKISKNILSATIPLFCKRQAAVSSSKD